MLGFPHASEQGADDSQFSRLERFADQFSASTDDLHYEHCRKWRSKVYTNILPSMKVLKRFHSYPTNKEASWLDLMSFVCRRRLHLDRLQWMVNHSYFNFISSLVISINVVYMGIVINDHAVRTIHQYSTHGWTPFLEMATPQWESKMDWFFTLLFTLEIAMRILGEECEFFFGPDWNWNCMDLLLVVTNMVEIVLTSLQRS